MFARFLEAIKPNIAWWIHNRKLHQNKQIPAFRSIHWRGLNAENGNRDYKLRLVIIESTTILGFSVFYSHMQINFQSKFKSIFYRSVARVTIKI